MCRRPFFLPKLLSMRSAISHNQLLICSLAFSLLALGCDNHKANPTARETTQPYKGQDVELLVPKSLNLPVAWEVQLQEWMTQTGATAHWNEYSADDESSLAKMLQAPAPSGGRLLLFPLARLSELDQFLAPLDTGRLADFDPKDILRGLRERIVSRDRSLVAIPVSAPVLVCC